MQQANYLRIDNHDSFIDSWIDCYLSETKKAGFVCTLQLPTMQQIHYGLNDRKKLLEVSKKTPGDFYLSLNAFNFGSRTSRGLKQLRNIGIDLDFYKLNMSLKDALKEVKKLIYQEEIPNPNLVINSGRGLQLIYTIAGGASPKMEYLTRYITAQYITKLRHLNADTACTDVSRVFRIPNSIHSKTGNVVTEEIWNKREYHLHELYDYVTPLERVRKPQKKQKGRLLTLPPKHGIKTLYSLNSARMSDLETLVTLRNGNIEKRNVLTYIYSYTVSLNVKTKEATFYFARQLNERLDDPQPIKEVERTSGRAYIDAMEFFKAYERNGFTMKNLYRPNDGLKKPMKNTTIIENLDITPDEIKQLTTLISPGEKTLRNTDSKRTKRRENGVQERSQYLKKQQQHTNEQLTRLQMFLDSEPNATKAQIADMMGISRQQLYNLLKKLKV